MTELNPGVILGLAGVLAGALMAALALAISQAPGWRELRSFALVAAAASLYSLFALVHVLGVAEDTVLLGDRLALAATFAYGLAWMHHLAIAGRRSLRRVERAAIVVGFVMMPIALIPGAMIVSPVRSVHVAWFGATWTMSTATPLGVVYVAFVLAMTMVAAFGGGRRWKDGWQTRLPMIGATTLVVTGVVDTLASMELISMPQLIEAVSVVVVGVLGVSYTRRFVLDAGRLEALTMKLEQEVASRTDELVQAQTLAARHERLAGLGRIAAGVAHEVNNPTAVIQQNLDRMQQILSESSAMTTELQSRLDRSRAATHRIVRIVRQLLETGLHASPDKATTTSFAVAPIVEQAVASAAATAPNLGVTISVPSSLVACGDPASLEQALINVLVNAAQATSDASGGGRAIVEGVRVGDAIHVTVTDNGPGIAPTISDRLFEPFTTTKPVGSGTGLGLAVSRSLLTRHHGDLFVASSGSDGTKMVLELRASDGPAQTPAERVPLAVAPSTADQDLRVLIIDDDEDLREVLVLSLARFYRVDEAGSVELAVTMFKNQAYDVVLCDVMMPDGGAESWLSQCASLDQRLDERTILLTGGPITATSRELVEVRRDRVVLKPPELDTLRPLIERLARS
jgi:signal transduction histidine kinase/CheY-like chemotaxis protein